MTYAARGNPAAGRPSQRGRPSSFDAHHAITQAAELLAEAGESGFTARALAQRTRIPVATLYRQLGDRDAMLRATLDHLAASLTWPTPPGGTSADAVALAYRQMFEMLAPHAWIAPILHGNQFGAHAVVFINAIFGALRELGLGSGEAVATHQKCWWLTRGALLQLRDNESDDLVAARARFHQITADHQLEHLRDLPAAAVPAGEAVESAVRAIVAAALAGPPDAG